MSEEGRLAGRGPGSDVTSVRFAQLARQLNQEATRLGLRAPAFRSPPRVPGVTRSITRRRDGSATVSVALRGRPEAAVTADMIDGVLAANPSGSTQSAACRDRLWSAVAPLLFAPQETSARPRSVAPVAAVAPVSPGGVDRSGADPTRRSEATAPRAA